MKFVAFERRGRYEPPELRAGGYEAIRLVHTVIGLIGGNTRVQTALMQYRSLSDRVHHHKVIVHEYKVVGQERGVGSDAQVVIAVVLVRQVFLVHLELAYAGYPVRAVADYKDMAVR